MQYILAAGIDPNVRDKRRRPAIFAAVRAMPVQWHVTEDLTAQV